MKQSNILGQSIDEWIATYPLLKEISHLNPVFWENPELKAIGHVSHLPVDVADMHEAEARWQRFAPFLMRAFPQTQGNNGFIESPLLPLTKMKSAIEMFYRTKISGRLYMKADNDLPIAGSIKARGGIYEVLKHAEDLALSHGLITKNDSYEKLTTAPFNSFFRQYTIAVGSTGNLGLSIGIISATLGFKVQVHMSADAKEWKKALLREKGVTVIEYASDYSKAVIQGRELSKKDPKSYFVDDENSQELFLGYSVAAFRLKRQLDQDGLSVDETHPLFVYLPCGVGGAPGGITFGLKHVFGDHVHCFFVEPTHAPAMLIGLLTGRHDQVSVQDFGIDNHTEADGLAVGRPSRFATTICAQLIDGLYTIEDQELFKLLTLLVDSEGIFLEPSATAGFQGPILLQRQTDYLKRHQLEKNMSQATHIVWGTGGALVPEVEKKSFYDRGRSLLQL
ncbi:D-serine dehydratase [Pullulanibacillus pueri]|uniref:Probable D-serine dehydratase n=1 Tax=Pullulanibacillus pueri TaxID=1437324 RepID=A0A8J2ZV48_9BACL|nr:D-serine ammonia-lyase [Pullulanibacillus pueri]MBM7682364.1 D-serine dehydratase [Pullulanibacillus pueri]GGH80638.1 putative D-serine dehydratase [Pullulanibacillus pueri]